MSSGASRARLGRALAAAHLGQVQHHDQRCVVCLLEHRRELAVGDFGRAARVLDEHDLRGLLGRHLVAPMADEMQDLRAEPLQPIEHIAERGVLQHVDDDVLASLRQGPQIGDDLLGADGREDVVLGVGAWTRPTFSVLVSISSGAPQAACRRAGTATGRVSPAW